MMSSTDLSSACGRHTSDHQDVKTLIEEEFQKQILTESNELKISRELYHPSGNNTDLWDSIWKPVNPAFCLACDTMFPDRLTLEEHTCPFVNFICSCGVSFLNYPEMWAHSTFHSHKGSCVPSHQSAIQSRITATKEQESKLKLLETTAKNLGLVQNTAHFACLPSPKPRYKSGQTINLWKHFKPVVKLETIRRFYSKGKYMCAICQEVFCKQDQLIEHVNSHYKAYIYGCNHCGLLLIGSVPPKPYHRCGSFQTAFSKRFTIGQMQRDPLLADSYPCPHCSIKFGHLGNLSNHIYLNHTNLINSEETSKTLSQVRSVTGVHRTLDSMPNEMQQNKKMSCALCGKRYDTIKMLGMHWCKIKVTLLKPEAVAKMSAKQEQQRCDPNYLAKRSCSEVTLRFQDICNIKTYDCAKLLGIKSEPIEVNLKMTTFPHSLSVKTEPELQDDDYGFKKNGTTILPNSIKSEEI
ncbi:zinc finger protein 883-like isoform X1 [Pangasianodon hypophthalmus]|uniref:zinc finger protein 883-like isoform X1 n=2 Tax=Pangasianodon hypophthalmus TaxID=310915 RepID=UPI000EFDB9E9|nr:zinc finger protein 883-like isoform X1 [Pangasianodon hypophthalmus]